MAFLDEALKCANRGFHVLPLKPRDKWPIVAGGCHAGTKDLDQVRLWWTKHPNANIGVSCGLSDLLVVDADHGLTCYEDFIAWRDRNGLPATYTVRTGRRLGADGKPEFGAQMYYSGTTTIQGRKTWSLDGVTGDFRGDGQLAVHPPSIHPDSGEAYEVICDLPIVPKPDLLLNLPTAEGKSTTTGQANDDGLIEGNRNEDMCSLIGQLRYRTRIDEDAMLDLMLQVNETRYAKGPMPEEEVKTIVATQYRLYPNPEVVPEAFIGSSRKAHAEALANQEAEVVEELDASLKATPLPDYPLAPFEDTVYLDFAKRASRGNYVPLSFFIEGAMTYAGAVCGNNLRGFAEEITPRLFTVLLGLAGAGKGTTFRRIRNSMPPIAP
jgi:hypothetical protein